MLIENIATILQEKTEGETVVTNIKIHAEHPLFEGHFPGNPVTPGVVLLQLFKEQAERFMGKTLQLSTASNIKFLSVIDPQINANVRLESAISTHNDRVELIGKTICGERISIKLKLGFKVVSYENN